MIVAYKGFEKDLSCTSGGHKFQYKLGIWNEEPEANCVQNGFHCAENPLDCLSYYPNWNNSVYYMVLVDGDIDEDGTDSKISCTRMKLVKELTAEEFVYVSLNYMVLHPTMRKSNKVHDELFRGKSEYGFEIVRGKNPKAAGKIGDVIGFAKENIDTKDITEISVITIDGEKFLPNILYCIDGTEARGTLV